MSQHPYPAVILAGGRASRMGGGDKMLLMLAGESLLSRLINKLTPQAGPLALNANGDAERFAEYDLPVLPDSMPDQPGPLAGILAAMDWAQKTGASAVVTVAGDTPFIPANLATHLQNQAGEAEFCIAASMDAGLKRLHPTAGLWPLRLREELRWALLAGQRRVREFAIKHGAEVAVWESSPFDPFYNINTPEDLRRAESLLQR